MLESVCFGSMGYGGREGGRRRCLYRRRLHEAVPITHNRGLLSLLILILGGFEEVLLGDRSSLGGECPKSGTWILRGKIHLSPQSQLHVNKRDLAPILFWVRCVLSFTAGHCSARFV